MSLLPICPRCDTYAHDGPCFFENRAKAILDDDRKAAWDRNAELMAQLAERDRRIAALEAVKVGIDEDGFDILIPVEVMNILRLINLHIVSGPYVWNLKAIDDAYLALPAPVRKAVDEMSAKQNQLDKNTDVT